MFISGDIYIYILVYKTYLAIPQSCLFTIPYFISKINVRRYVGSGCHDLSILIDFMSIFTKQIQPIEYSREWNASLI